MSISLYPQVGETKWSGPGTLTLSAVAALTSEPGPAPAPAHAPALPLPWPYPLSAPSHTGPLSVRICPSERASNVRCEESSEWRPQASTWLGDRGGQQRGYPLAWGGQKVGDWPPFAALLTPTFVSSLGQIFMLVIICLKEPCNNLDVGSYLPHPAGQS